jgi:broad specificity phosphatase PhoE
VSNSEPILVTVLRHGAVAGRAHVLRGTSDVPLTPQGIAQMYATLERLGAPEFDALATSPLRRCQAFSAAYTARHGLPLLQLPCFSELDFGEWEELTPDEAAQRDATTYRAFRASYGVHAPPQGESLTALRARVAHGWHDWMRYEGGRQRLLVTHAGVMRALLMELFGFSPAQVFQIALPEAACLRISHLQGQSPFLLGIN